MRFVLPLVAAIVLAAPAMAQKVGVIDFQRAVVDSAEFKKAYATLEAKYKPKQDQLQKAQQTLQDIQIQLGNAAQLSQAGAAELEARGQRTQTLVERLTQDLQEDFEGERDAALRVVTTRYADVLKKLAAEKGLDAIVDTTAVRFFGPSLDVTDAAITAYNAAFPAK